jgi:hypothetical protein
LRFSRVILTWCFEDLMILEKLAPEGEGQEGVMKKTRFSDEQIWKNRAQAVAALPGTD